MKTMKSLITAISVIALMLTLSVPAFAAESKTRKETTAAAVSVPVYCDDDLFTWDDEPFAVVRFFERLGERLSATRIVDEAVPMGEAPAARIPTHYDDDPFTWDEDPLAVVNFLKDLFHG